MEKIIFHIDVNSAFLSWTAKKLLDEGKGPDIRNVPSIIGGDKEKRHGIVLAKSIPAKKYGIVTGEPVVDAFRKCPDLIMIPPSHDYYHEQSQRFVELLGRYTPDIEQVSIDECYLDYTGISHNFDSPIEAARIIKDRIRDELGFTVNIGISNRKVLAKMASDFTKPDRIHTLYIDEISKKMWPLPVSDLFMAGKSSVNVLHKLGIKTIGQLANTPVSVLEAHLKSHGRVLWEYANGIDGEEVKSEKEEVKGIGNSITLSEDVTDVGSANKVLLWLAEKVASRIRKAHQKAGVICVEIKYADFTKTSRQMTVEPALNTSTGIYERACELFGQVWNGKPIRLLGIRTTKLEDENSPEQMSLFDMDFDGKNANNLPYVNDEGHGKISNEKQKKLDFALDKIRKKYGNDVISRASLMKRKERGTHER